MVLALATTLATAKHVIGRALHTNKGSCVSLLLAVGWVRGSRGLHTLQLWG